MNCFFCFLFQGNENRIDMQSLIKNRLLGETRFFLNKSNTKWISIGVLPGYIHLNGQNFSVVLKLSGDTGGITLNLNGFKSIIKMFKSMAYFSKYGNSDDDTVLETGILISEFSLGGSPCYKVMNQKENGSVCLGLKTVEELIELSGIVLSYVEKMDIASLEEKFITCLENEDIDMNEITDITIIDLLLNFHDFVTCCVELKKSHEIQQQQDVMVNIGESIDSRNEKQQQADNDTTAIQQTPDHGAELSEDEQPPSPKKAKKPQYKKKYINQKSN